MREERENSPLPLLSHTPEDFGAWPLQARFRLPARLWALWAAARRVLSGRALPRVPQPQPPNTCAKSPRVQ